MTTTKNGKVVQLQHVTEEVNHDTGEVVTTRKTFGVKVGTVDEFIMTFVDWIAPLFKVKSLKDQQLLLMLMKEAEYNTGRISVTQAMRDRIKEKVGLNNTNLSRALANLRNNGLISGGKGEYYLNPKIFWKGSIAEREAYLKSGKAMEFTVRFSQEGHDLPDTEEFSTLEASHD